MSVFDALKYGEYKLDTIAEKALKRAGSSWVSRSYDLACMHSTYYIDRDTLSLDTCLGIEAHTVHIRCR